MKREKTDYPGVFFRVTDRIGGGGKERVYYVVYKKAGKVFEEKAGRQYQNAMTAAKAARIRGELIEGKRKTRAELRAEEAAARAEEAKTTWTLQNIFESYKENNPGLRSVAQDESRFRRYLNPTLGGKEPGELVTLDVDRIRVKMLKTRAPATVRNTLELLRRLLNYARNKGLCEVPNLKIQMPNVDNETTEDLTPEQMDRLLMILREGVTTGKDGTPKVLNPDARDAMMLALFTGMRRSEIFRLTWTDLDFHGENITLRETKGGKKQTIPMPDVAREVLAARREAADDPVFVFPGRGGKCRADAAKHLREIRDAAGLPKDFRPMHGLRHVFASGLASSGQVPLYIIQRLLTHKSPAMTQRYAHLSDKALRDAANLAGDLRKGKKEA